MSGSISLKRLTRIVRALRTPLADDNGVSAVEFALVLPVMITLFIGGFELSQGVSAYRKMTATTRTVADLVTQADAKGLTKADMTRILNASAQVMAPFPTTSLKIVVTQFVAPASPLLPAVVSWSVPLNTTALTKAETLPAGVVQPLATIVRTDVSYEYTPPLGDGIAGTFKFKDSLYMSPRQVAAITYTGK